MSTNSALLSAQNLTFHYSPTVPILTGFSCEIHEGEVVALTGPSGRGKSTLLYLLGLLMTPGSGEVVVLNNSTAGSGDRYRAHLRAHAFGFVFQDAALDPSRTVLDNVIETSHYRDVDLDLSRVEAQRLLTRFGVAVRADHRPGEISGGQAQRIALARALLGSPPIVLADEPTGNLDSLSADTVLTALRQHAETGAAVVVATHDEEVMRRCDRKIEL